jgi:hypothetical protein
MDNENEFKAFSVRISEEKKSFQEVCCFEARFKEPVRGEAGFCLPWCFASA